MKISLKLPDRTLHATLEESAAAEDFASPLPLTLRLEDYANTEKVADLPKRLTRAGAPAGITPSAGDIAYYAPWGNLAIYHKSFRYSEGLILLGRLDHGAEALATPGPVTVTIELAADEPRKGKDI